MASVTITDLLMLVAVLFIIYFIFNKFMKKEGFADIEDLQKFTENTLASTRLVEKDKRCSQTSINQTKLDYIFNGKKFVR
jgi:hypothetical protein